jgi:hypothetical protein
VIRSLFKEYAKKVEALKVVTPVVAVVPVIPTTAEDEEEEEEDESDDDFGNKDSSSKVQIKTLVFINEYSFIIIRNDDRRFL